MQTAWAAQIVEAEVEAERSTQRQLLLDQAALAAMAAYQQDFLQVLALSAMVEGLSDDSELAAHLHTAHRDGPALMELAELHLQPQQPLAPQPGLQQAVPQQQQQQQQETQQSKPGPVVTASTTGTSGSSGSAGTDACTCSSMGQAAAARAVAAGQPIQLAQPAQAASAAATASTYGAPTDSSTPTATATPSAATTATEGVQGEGAEDEETTRTNLVQSLMMEVGGVCMWVAMCAGGRSSLLAELSAGPTRLL